MSDKPVSIVDIHTRKVNEYCASLCKEQLKVFEGTAFEDFGTYLRRTWSLLFKDFGLGDDELLPVIQASIAGNVIDFYSALVSLQFTSRPVPVARDDIKQRLFSCVEWRLLKGDGVCEAKSLGVEASDDFTETLTRIISTTVRDIFTGHDEDKCPSQLINLICQIIVYHVANGQVYTGSEYNVVLEGHETPVIKACFTNGLKTSHVYIDHSRAKEDWDDFISRYNDHCKELGDTTEL